MVGLRAGLAEGARLAACTVLSPQGNAARFFGEIVEQIPVVGGPIALPALTFANAAGLICDSQPTPAQQESGETQEVAQCPVDYDWEVTFLSTFNSGFPDEVDTISGRSTGPFERIPDGATDSRGNPIAGWNATGGVDPKLTNDSIYKETIIVTDSNFTRVDGQPDNCGSTILPPPLPPGDRTVTRPVNIDNTDIDVDFRVNSPEININGDINIPINIKGPTFDFDVSFSLSTGDIVFKFGGGGEGGDCCPQIDDPPEDETEETEKIIRGVVIRSLVAGDSPYYNELPQDDGEDLFVPYAGLVRFAREVNGSLVWSDDLRVKSNNQDIPCPFDGGAVEFSVNPQPGASWTTKPYYAKVRLSSSEE